MVPLFYEREKSSQSLILSDDWIACLQKTSKKCHSMNNEDSRQRLEVDIQFKYSDTRRNSRISTLEKLTINKLVSITP